jgi:hypothetical protein
LGQSRYGSNNMDDEWIARDDYKVRMVIPKQKVSKEKKL